MTFGYGIDNPDVSVTDNVKSAALQRAINQLLGQWGINAGLNDADISKFTQQWEGGQGDAATRTGQEVGALGDFYNGNVERTLSGMRAQRSAALNAALTQNLQRLKGATNKLQLTSGGGNNSYLDRLGVGESSQMAVKNALDQADQTRADYGYTEGQKVNLAGRRNALQDSLFQRILVPSSVRSQNQMSNIGALTGIQNANNANNFYGLKSNPGILDQIMGVAHFGQDFANANASTGMSVMSMMGGGMMGGGKPSGYQPPSTSPQFAPDYGMTGGVE